MLVGLGFVGCSDVTDTRPNIVMILVDDLRWDDFGAGGHPFVETPNIDRLADEGARFLNAFASTPLCSPSRASDHVAPASALNSTLATAVRPAQARPTAFA